MKRKDHEGVRSFIALDISPSNLGTIKALQGELKRKVEGIRWVKSEGIHLTLKFLGNVKEERFEALCSSLKPLCAAHSPIELCPGMIGAFPALNRPRVIWLGVEGSLDALRSLWQDIEKDCFSAGFERDKRSFSPHLTLGRVKDFKKAAGRLGQAIEVAGDFPFEPFQVVTVHLYRSELRPEGAVYTKIMSFPLEGREQQEDKE